MSVVAFDPILAISYSLEIIDNYDNNNLNLTTSMNKENMVKNISLISRKKSPIPQKNMSQQPSFRNINHKSFYKNKELNHNDLSLSPIGSKRLKTSTFRGENSSIMHTDMSESVISSGNNPLI